MDLKVTCTIVPLQCRECGVIFGVEEGLFNIRQRDHRTMHCTNGHTFKLIQENPEADKLAQIVERQEARIEQLEAELSEKTPAPVIPITLLGQPAANNRNSYDASRYTEA